MVNNLHSVTEPKFKGERTLAVGASLAATHLIVSPNK
jgi:hypothetical protein